MARPYKRSSGTVVEIASCAAAHTVGDLVIENGFVGVCLATSLISTANQLQIEGRFRVKLPASCNQGDYIYATGAPPTNGTLLASITVATGITKTAASNTLIGQVMDTPTAGTIGDILLLPQQGGKK